MKVKPNPAEVGIFVLGALAFLVLGLIFLGQSVFRGTTYRFVTYFDETVSGLEIGASVKFRGVQIGKVTDLKIFFAEIDDTAVSSRIPVIYDIQADQIEEAIGGLVNLSKPDDVRQYIDQNLRARLAVSSFITGLMYVELDSVDPMKYPAEYYSQFAEFYEVPAFRGPLAAISENVTSIMERFSSIDIEEVSRELMVLMQTLNTEITQANLPSLASTLQKTAESIKETAESVTKLVESREIKMALNGLDRVLKQFNVLAAKISSSIEPTSLELQTALQQFSSTMAGLADSNVTLQNMLRPQSSLRSNLDNTLVSLEEAAHSLKRLADFLERNPGALITGRSPATNE